MSQIFQQIDAQYADLEARLVRRASQLLEQGFFAKPGEVLRAIQVINGTRRRSLAEAAPQPESTTIVQIAINPEKKYKALDFKTSSSNEIVEVNGRPLITMSERQLQNETRRINSAPASKAEETPVEIEWF